MAGFPDKNETRTLAGAGKMKSHKSVLITDLDNTLFDWVHLWHSCFSAMFEKIIEISGVPETVLKSEIKTVHQMHGTSEYSFLVEELPSLLERVAIKAGYIRSDGRSWCILQG